MKHYFFVILFIALSLGNAFSKSNNRAQLRLITNKGNITIELYNETPLHRDNFLKLAKEKYFDNTLFHRVINDFMIQGGDPDSRNARKGEALGEGGPGYQIKAEFNPNLIHKKGALAAARNGDNINPQKKSAGSQFYLVKGRVYTLQTLKNVELKKNKNLRRGLITKAKKQYKNTIDSLIKLYKTGKDTLALSAFLEKQNKVIDSIVYKQGFHFTPLQKEYYSTIGGVPHLDGAYTVFGEIVDGLPVLDSISVVKTDKRDRPKEDIVVKSIRVIKNYKK